MARTSRKKRGRPPTGIRRPVITIRVHEDIYEVIRRSAEQGKLTLSEEAARRIGVSVALDQGGAEPFLLRQGYTKILDSDGNEIWAKGVFAFEKYMAARPEQAAMIEQAVERGVERALQKGKRS
jgi:hypothetical protein